MPADVEEGVEAAVVATHHQDRHAAQIVGAVVAGLGQLAGEGEEQRVAAKQQLALALGLLGARLGRGRVEIDGLGELGGVAVHEVEHPARQRNLRGVFHPFSPTNPMFAAVATSN